MLVNKFRTKKLFTLILALVVVMGIIPMTGLIVMAAGSGTVTVGGVALTVSDTVPVVYAVNDLNGAVTTNGANEDNYTVKLEILNQVFTLTLKDATINNLSGDGINADGALTIVGIDTAAEGSNTVCGGKSGICAKGDIVISGKLGDIEGDATGGIYCTDGNITISKDAVVGNLKSDWYTLQTDEGNIIIDGKVGSISGVIGITSEYNHDVIINGEVGDITGSDYGIFAYKNLNVGKDAKVGNISGGIAGMISVADIVIDGTVNKADGTYGVYAMGNVSIGGTLNNAEGQCAIRALGEYVDISGTVGAVIGNGGSDNMKSSFGVRADNGKISVKSVIGPISASSDGEGVTVVALYAKTGIELADDIAIKLPEDSTIKMYNDSYYTVFNADDTSAEKVELTRVYTVTFIADGKTVSTVKVYDGEDAKLPDVPAKEGYTAEWDKDGKTIKENTEIKAVYTKIPDDKDDTSEIVDTGDNNSLTQWIILLAASTVCLLGVLFLAKKSKTE